MSTYNIELNENRAVSYDVPCWGSEYEHEATILSFTFPEQINAHDISTFTKYIEFKEHTSNKAEEDKAIFYDLIAEDNTYVISHAITFYNSMDVQVVLRKTLDADTGETLVWKSKIFTINFCDSINASDIIDPEDPRIDLIQQLVDEVEQAKEVVETLNSNLVEEELERNNAEEIRKQNEETRQLNEIERNVFEKFNELKEYKINNKVAYEGSSYVCIQNTSAGTLPTDETYWLLIAQKGDIGASPERGVDYWTEEDQNKVVNEAVEIINSEIGLILDDINGEVI